jgi:TonB-dependent receptor
MMAAAVELPRVARPRVLTLLFAALALAVPRPMSAQTAASGTITGRVRNQLTGRYINNAQVSIAGTDRTATTDEYGQYRLFNVPAGTAKVKVFFTGLDPVESTVEVTAGSTAQKDFVLTNASRLAAQGYKPAGDDTVVLDAYVLQAQEMDGSAVAINEQRFAANLKNVVAADAFGDVTEGNPGEFVKYLPGVSVDYVAADVRSISVRGFGSSFTSMSLDGNRMASASSSGSSRSFELEQVSMNNVARIELTKEPTPSTWADSLGGSINLVSKNAFERDHSEFKYRGYLSANSEDVELKKTPGPKVADSYKVRPGFDFSYANPLTPNFGIVVNALRSDQFNEQHRSRNRWEFNSGDGTASDPYLRRYELQDGPKTTLRQSLGLNADWKVAQDSVLSFGYQWNDYDSFFGNRNYVWDVGSSLKHPNYDDTFTQGAAKKGNVTGATSFRHKFGTTNNLNLDFKRYTDDLTILAGGYFSYATNKYRDTGDGHFSNVGTRQKNLTVRFDDIQEFKPGKITALTATGEDVTVPVLSNLNLLSGRSQQYDSWDQFSGFHASVKKALNFSVPANLQVGVDYRAQVRDIIRRQDDYNYVGPDGKAETTDDNAAPFKDTNYVNQDPHFGWPAPEWIDPYKVYQNFEQHPDYWVANVNNWANRVQNDYRIKETITAAYVQADTKLIDGKLSVLGGVRFEKTKDEGLGFLYNPDAIYDANGNLITSDPYTQQRLMYQRRAQAANTDYDGYYPSLHFVYNAADNFVVRLEYARTLGRPDFDEILPGTVLDPDDTALPGDPGGTVTVRNTGLKPYESENFDLSLEYYFKPAGVVSLGVFQKNITDFFGAITKIVDQDDLARYNLTSDLLGWNLETKINSGDAKVTGVEFNYVQQLNKLPGALKNLSIFANGTLLHLKGNNTADFTGFIEKSANWGFSYDGKRFDANIKWNYRGRQVVGPVAVGAVQGNQYYDPRTYLDVNFSYSINRRCVLFFNARNLLNVPQDLLTYADVTPDYARTERQEEFGVQYALGIKGTW